MCHGKRGLRGDEAQAGITGKEPQHFRPFAPQRSHLHEAIGSRSVSKQLTVLDVYVSQPSSQRISAHGISPCSAAEVQLYGKITSRTMPEFRPPKSETVLDQRSRTGSFKLKQPRNAPRSPPARQGAARHGHPRRIGAMRAAKMRPTSRWHGMRLHGEIRLRPRASISMPSTTSGCCASSIGTSTSRRNRPAGKGRSNSPPKGGWRCGANDATAAVPCAEAE